MTTADDPAWSAVASPRTILLACPRSFCAGVERAIEIVEQALDQRRPPVYVRKQIVHNSHVVADLEARGAVFVDELSAVPEGATVVFSAHGVSPAIRDDAARRGLEVQQTVLVQTAADVDELRVDDPERVSYLTQTTLAVDETAEIIGALHARFPALRGPASDDICYATTNRQDALTTISDESDLVLVVGSSNSSNSRRLVELARRRGTPGYLIDDAGDIRPEWLADVRVVGLTAGASAPPQLVDAVIDVLAGLGQVTVVEREVTRENIQFGLPPDVRPP
jgi:4-hydroxy-3-methylbut-2-enyl diphosphate reductase